MATDGETGARGFYDDLAEDYHLIYRDWWGAVEYSSSVLGSLLAGEGIDPPAAVWDATCGIGTQALGLATLGYRVHGSDLSERAVARARREALARGITATFSVADLRDLSSTVGGGFQAVVSCDNALPHLLSSDDLDQALQAMHAGLVPGGRLLASIRDYDAVLAQAGDGALPTGILPVIIDTSEGRRVVSQAWSWASDEPIYDVDLFVLQEHRGTWTVQHHQTRYRAYRRAEMADALRRAGFDRIRWLAPDESGYYQPIVIAHG